MKPNPDALVRTTNVHKTFRRGAERIDVLLGVNLQVAKGEFLALMGPSGSGKTTLLNLIGGLDRPPKRGPVAASRRTADLNVRSQAGRAGGPSTSGSSFSSTTCCRCSRPNATSNCRCCSPICPRPIGGSTSRRRSRSSAFRIGRSHYPRQPLRRRTTARRHRARDRDRSDPAALRRAHRRSRPQVRRRNPEPVAQALNREHGKTIIMVTHDPHAAERASRVLQLEKGTLLEAAV